MSDRAPFLDLTDDQLQALAISEGERLSGLPAGTPSVGNMRSIFEVEAMLIQHAHDIGIRPIAEYIDPVAAQSWFLRMHGLHAGVPFRGAAATRGHAAVTSATGGRLRAGAVLLIGGQPFTTDDDVRLAADEAAAVAVTARLAGAAGNVAAGAAVTFEVEPVPADATAEVLAGWVTAPGYDADDVSTPAGTERYRRRVLPGFAVRGEANTLARYRLAAFGVPGVSSVAAGRAVRGYGSADISVLFNGRLPTDDEILLVQAAIEDEGLVGRDVRASAPRVVSVAVTVSITGTATTATVEAAIEAWWRANVGIGDGVLVQTLYARAAAGVVGVSSIVYSSPASNLAAVANTWYQPSIRVTRA